MRRCICILSSRLDLCKVSIIRRLEEQAKDSDVDVWILFDINAVNVLSSEFLCLKPNVHFFSFYDIKSDMHYDFRSVSIHMGNCHLPMIEFSRTHKYDCYMFYEDDAVYTGNIIDLYDKILSISDSDFYTLNDPDEIAEDDNWAWVNPPNEFKIPDDAYPYWRKQLLTLYVVKHDCLRYLDEQMRSGNWYGHHEMLMPTMIGYGGFKQQAFNHVLDGYQESFSYLYIKSAISNKVDVSDNFYCHPIKKTRDFSKLIGDNSIKYCKDYLEKELTPNLNIFDRYPIFDCKND